MPCGAVINSASGRIRNRSDYRIVPALLPDQAHLIDHIRARQTMAARKAAGRDVIQRMVLCERLQFPLLVQHAVRHFHRYQHHAHMPLLIGQIAQQHIAQLVFAKYFHFTHLCLFQCKGQKRRVSAAAIRQVNGVYAVGYGNVRAEISPYVGKP